MRVHRHVLEVSSSAPIEFIDITAWVRAWAEAQGATDGLLTVSTPHTTARIVVNEPDAALQRDMVRQLQRWAPSDAPYEHNENTVDGRNNAHAHLAALFMPASESLQMARGALRLGTWQAVFFVELDGPREKREIHLQLIAE